MLTTKPKPKYTGIIKCNGKWKTEIPKSFQPQAKRFFVGYFDTEEEAYKAQTKKIEELNLKKHERQYTNNIRCSS